MEEREIVWEASLRRPELESEFARQQMATDVFQEKDRAHGKALTQETHHLRK